MLQDGFRAEQVLGPFTSTHLSVAIHPLPEEANQPMSKLMEGMVILALARAFTKTRETRLQSCVHN